MQKIIYSIIFVSSLGFPAIAQEKTCLYLGQEGTVVNGRCVPNRPYAWDECVSSFLSQPNEHTFDKIHQLYKQPPKTELKEWETPPSTTDRNENVDETLGVFTLSPLIDYKTNHLQHQVTQIKKDGSVVVYTANRSASISPNGTCSSSSHTENLKSLLASRITAFTKAASTKDPEALKELLSICSAKMGTDERKFLDDLLAESKKQASELSSGIR